MKFHFALTLSLTLISTYVSAKEFTCFPTQYADSLRFMDRVFNEAGDKVITNEANGKLSFVRNGKTYNSYPGDVFQIDGVKYCSQFKSESQVAARMCYLAHATYEEGYRNCLKECITEVKKQADVSAVLKNAYQVEINSSVEGSLIEKTACFEKSVLENLNLLTTPSYEVKSFFEFNGEVVKPMIIAKSNRPYELLSSLKFVSAKGEIEDVGIESFAKKLSTGKLKYIDSSALKSSVLKDANMTGKCVSTILANNAVATFDLKANGDTLTLTTKTMGAVNFRGALQPVEGGFEVLENLYNGKSVKRDVKILSDKKVLIDRYFCEIF